jgi:hypothetical protein
VGEVAFCRSWIPYCGCGWDVDMEKEDLIILFPAPITTTHTAAETMKSNTKSGLFTFICNTGSHARSI